jgi:hypothetical protein
MNWGQIESRRQSRRLPFIRFQAAHIVPVDFPSVGSLKATIAFHGVALPMTNLSGIATSKAPEQLLKTGATGKTKSPSINGILVARWQESTSLSIFIWMKFTVFGRRELALRRPLIIPL